MKYYEQWKAARDFRGKDRKRQLIERMGGQCSVCGYNKCTRALTFHHKDESTKSFTLDTSNLYRYSMYIIDTEAAKCTLLCHNCHQVLHEKIDNENNINTSKRLKYINFKKELIAMLGGCCKICNLKSEYLSLMTFHHLRDKAFHINSRTLRDLARSKILDEVQKCILLCFNCHMEVEDHAIILDCPSIK